MVSTYKLAQSQTQENPGCIFLGVYAGTAENSVAKDLRCQVGAIDTLLGMSGKAIIGPTLTQFA